MTRLTTTPIFDQTHPKRCRTAFNFCESVSTCKKLVHSICSFTLQIQSILESRNHIGQTYFLIMLTPKIFNHLFNWCGFVPACEILVNSVSLFLRYSQFYNPQTRLATPIFDHEQPKNC